MDNSFLTGLAIPLFVVIQTLSVLTMVVYGIQYFRVVRHRRREFLSLGDECISSIATTPILMIAYAVTVILLTIVSSGYFISLIPNS